MMQILLLAEKIKKAKLQITQLIEFNGWRWFKYCYRTRYQFYMKNMNLDKPFCHKKKNNQYSAAWRLLTQLLEKHFKKFGMDREVFLAYLNLMLVGSLRILESNRSKISQASIRVGGYISIENK
jgi:hypothetical protein